MEVAKLVEEIKKLDTKSDEFFEVYKVTSEKYWTFENPDEFQSCCATLVKFAERGDEEEVIVALKTISQIIDMKVKNNPSAVLHLSFKNGIDYKVEIFKDGIAKDQFYNLINKVQKSMPKGKFGKNYFKKDGVIDLGNGGKGKIK